MKIFKILALLLACPFLGIGQVVTVTFTPITVDANTIKFEIYASCPTTRYLAAIPSGWTYTSANNFVGSAGSWVNGPGGNINLPGSYTFSGSPNFRIAYAQTATCPPANRFELSSSPQLIGTFTIDNIPSVTFPFTATLRTSGANSISVTTYPDNVNATGGLVHTVALGTLVAPATTVFTAPLPVELTRFKATEQASNNLIEWATASELNSQYHIVERSADGIDNWKEVGRKHAAGTTTVEHEYELTDEDPLMLSYYRLKLLDFNGSYEYSEVVSVQRSTNGGFSVLNMYPMPTDRAVTLQVSLEEDTNLTFTVSDMAGRVLSIRKMEGTKGINSMDLDVADLPPGQYLVEIDNGVVKLPQQLVKQ